MYLILLNLKLFTTVKIRNFCAVKIQDEEDWNHLYLASKISVSHFSTSLLISQPQRGLQHLAIDKQSAKLV
ncbi:hypothetical protein T03_8921 [Trichinella britovi]|uniref:Uncharacterized protein n=1 Tax=Trichinella britovi TaxID=45882 RepID=A0A0V1D1N0_TRIBR|nr:hypothetical protein T03_8921 [Trichinella britovi]